MKKSSMIGLGAILTALLLVPQVYGAKKHLPYGPAEKVTGEVKISRPWDGKYAYAEFNAHEATEKHPAKGRCHLLIVRKDGTIYREMDVKVENVIVEGKWARFDGVCTYDSWGTRVGKRLYVKAQDRCIDGINRDRIWWSWESPNSYRQIVVGGDLVVHSWE